MNEISRPLEVIEAEINFYKNQTATGIIEIGKRLIEAKSQLQHGEWGKWLEEKVEFSQRTANQFMRVATEITNSNSLANLAQTKVFLLLDVPAEQREDFIESNPIEDMTTRELQQAIKDKKALEQLLEDERNKPLEVVEKIIEKPVIPKEYENIRRDMDKLKLDMLNKDNELSRLKRERDSLKETADINERNSKRYTELKSQIENLTKEKNDISRRLNSTTELSGLVVEIESLLKNKLAPIKYSRAITEAATDRIVKKNLSEIIEIVTAWCDEMKKYIKTNDFEVVEVEYERIDD